MPEDKYAIRFDETIGRAYVDLSGEIAPQKVLNTFAAITLNQKWAEGDRSVLWNAQEALLTGSFEFAHIFRATPMSKTLTKPGRSAIVVQKSDAMIAKVARFYQSIAATTTRREIEIFFSEAEADAWLDR